METNYHKEMNEALALIPSVVGRTHILCTEDSSPMISSVTSYVASMFKEVRKSFSGNADRLDNVKKKDLTEQAITLNKLKKDIDKVIANVKLMEVESIETPVTLGLKVDLYTMVKSMTPIVTSISENLAKTIDEADGVVSNMLANPDHRKKLKPGKRYQEITGYSSTIHDFMKATIDERGTMDRLPIGKVIPNINSLNEIYHELVKQNKLFTYANILAIRKSVTVLNDKLDSLYDLFVAEKDELTISKEAISELAYSVESLADYVTKSISIFYMVNQANSMSTNLVNLINKQS